MTDGLDRIEANGPSALADMYRRYAGWLTARVSRRYGAQAAEDLVQETWLRVAPYKALGEIRHPRAFLLRVASNLAIDAGRKAGRAAGPGLEDLSLQHTADAGSQTEAVFLRQVILSLPQPLRDVFVLSRFGGLTNTQIAEQLGISPKTVEWRMTRALAHCAAQFRR